MNRIVRWWSAPDQFDWLGGYLQARGLGRPLRRMLALVAASLTLVPINAVWGPAAVDSAFTLLLALASGVAGLTLALLWMTRWPTRSESIVFAAIGSITIAAGCLWQTDPLIGLLFCTALAVSGGYIALFHSARYMLLNFALAMGVGAWQAYRVAESGELMFAATGFFLVLELNIGVPFAIQVVVRTLGADLLRSERDPLTGLLNRRAFTDAVVGRMMTRGDHAQCALALLDLDRFKSINDAFGHAAGDEALIEVAAALTEACPETALVCRMGGEEFLVAEVFTTSVPADWAQCLCAAVESVSYRVTASVGTATASLRNVDADQAAATFHQLVRQADMAMYSAKRRGGNRVQHAGAP